MRWGALQPSPAAIAAGWYFTPPLLARHAVFPLGRADLPLRYAHAPLVSKEGVALLAAGRLTLDFEPHQAAALARALPDGWTPAAQEDVGRDLLGGLAERARGAPLAELLAAPISGPGLTALLPAGVAPLAAADSTMRLYPAPSDPQGTPPAIRPYARVLLVGLDGADWELIDPLLEKGEMPHLRGLLARGARARLRALTPILSPLLWTSIATGVGPQRHGITDFLAASRETGAEIPVTSSMRRVEALWNIASEHGLSAGIVGWWATWPAERVSGFIVSDRVAAPLFGQADETASLRRRTWPESLSLSIQALVVPPAGVPASELQPFLGPAGPAPANTDEQLRALATAVATARTYQRISLRLVSAYQPELAAVYFAGTDTIAHQFMRYRPPRMAGVTPDEQRAWGPVVDRYYTWQDKLLGELIDAASPDTLVVVCSDHGFKTGTSRPQTDPRIGVGAAADWHRRFGILVVAGPGVKQGSTMEEDASILDVTPTVLAALGLPVARDLEGQVLQQAFTAPLPIAAVDHYPAPPLSGSSTAEASSVDDEMVAKLRSLGYIAPEGANALNNQGVMLMESGRLAEAAETFAAALRAEPRFLYARINQGRARLLMKRYDEAMASFQSALELEPQRAETLDLIGNTCMERGDLAGAESWFQKALRLQPDDPGTRNSLGLLYQRQGKLDQAAAAFARVVEVDPDYVEGYNNLGLIRRQQGDADAAIKAFQKAIDVDASFPGSYNNMGLALQDRGWLDAARESFVRGLSVNPGNAILLNNLGTLDLAQGDFTSARLHFEESIKADPDYPSAHNNLGALEERLGDRAAARAQYEKAAAADAHYLDPALNLARLEIQDGQEAAAQQRLRGILAIDPGYAPALLQLGYLLERAGNLDEALRLANAALQTQPRSADPHNLLAEIHLAAGRRDEAVRELKRSLEINPDQAQVTEALRKAEAAPQ